MEHVLGAAVVLLGAFWLLIYPVSLHFPSFWKSVLAGLFAFGMVYVGLQLFGDSQRIISALVGALLGEVVLLASGLFLERRLRQRMREQIEAEREVALQAAKRYRRSADEWSRYRDMD